MHNMKSLLGLSVVCCTMLATPLALAGGRTPPFLAAANDLPDASSRYIVQFKQQGAISTMAMSTQQRSSVAKSNAQVITGHGGKVKKMLERFNAIGASLSASELKALQNDPAVQGIEPDPLRYPMSSELPEWTPWGISMVQAAGSLGNNASTGKTVCIIDTGYYVGHPDLPNSGVSGESGNQTGNWYSPGFGGSHGTHVAGTIAGVANNGEGVVGIFPAQQVDFYIVRVFDDDGNWATASDLIDAAESCADHGADVINMSLGGGGSSTTERNAFATLLNDDVLPIAAAGNDGSSSYSYPASYPAVMSVAATDSHNDVASFSQHNGQVEIAAPGVAVRSTVVPGDGREADLVIGGTSYATDELVPHSRYISQGGSYVTSDINGSVSGQLVACSTSSNGNVSCSNANNRICLIERGEDETATGGYPEIDSVAPCANAGGIGAIVYSTSELPGLQSPFLVDANNAAPIPTISVDRQTGQALQSRTGSTATLTVYGDADYAYYNGTSMATPHVTGVAALVWSYFPSCTAAQIRSALDDTAQDLGSSGRDSYYGYGLVQAQDAVDYLNTYGCSGDNSGGGSGGDTSGGFTETGLSASSSQWLMYSDTLPSGVSTLTVTISGGSGDADLYVNQGSQPDQYTHDCRPYLLGNNETCTFTSPTAGEWYFGIRAYSAFSGVTLTVEYE